MKAVVSLLLLCLMSAPALAQDDACGRASLEAMDKQPPEKDPAMQAKMDRLRANLWKGYEQCVATLRRAADRDTRLGLPAQANPLRRPDPQPVQSTDSDKPGEHGAACSVVSASGKPCVQKVSETMGEAGHADQVVFGNSCISPIELSVLYRDASRALATVKPGNTATLFCNGCGGVKSTQASCR